MRRLSTIQQEDLMGLIIEFLESHTTLEEDDIYDTVEEHVTMLTDDLYERN